jgi:hypothetical protein
MKDIILESLPKGNTRTFKIEITIDSLPPNLTNWKIFFTMKRNYNDLDDVAVVKKLVTTYDVPTSGIAYVELLPVDTESLEVRKYYYDFKAITDDLKEYTLQKGTINIDYSVTRRDS